MGILQVQEGLGRGGSSLIGGDSGGQKWLGQGSHPRKDPSAQSLAKGKGVVKEPSQQGEQAQVQSALNVRLPVDSENRTTWRRKWQPTPVFSPGKPHEQRSLASCSPWDHKESDTTERLTTIGKQTNKHIHTHRNFRL